MPILLWESGIPLSISYSCLFYWSRGNPTTPCFLVSRTVSHQSAKKRQLSVMPKLLKFFKRGKSDIWQTAGLQPVQAIGRQKFSSQESPPHQHRAALGYHFCARQKALWTPRAWFHMLTHHWHGNHHEQLPRIICAKWFYIKWLL